jgi:hypothetical protein
VVLLLLASPVTEEASPGLDGIAAFLVSIVVGVKVVRRGREKKVEMELFKI